jgi:hypothetical protein
MDYYLMSLLLGGAGLGAMALSGLGRHGHGGAHHGHGHSHGHAHVHGHTHGHGHAHGHAPGHAPGAHAPGAGHGIHAHHLWALASPRVLFSVLLGVGTAGLALRPFAGGWALLAAAVAGGVVFERLVVTPLWNFMFRFASEPAATLEHSIAGEATAVTTFDGNGQGIVAVELDGQVMQVLGTLQPNDRALGVRVRAGERVRIEDVDTRRNRCTVSVL